MASPDRDLASRARTYYRALDDGDYEALSALLDPAFVQERPDLTLEGRDRFVRFMREERPRTDTGHAIDAVFVRHADDSDENGPPARPSAGVAVRGRLLTADGERMARFVDVFTDAADGDGFARLDTYTQ